MLDQRGHGDHIHVAPGEDGDHVLALHIQVLQGGHSEQAGVFHHHLMLLHHIQKGVHQFRIRNGQDAVYIFLYIGEHQVAGGLDRHAIGDGVGGGEGDHMAGLQAGLHGGGALRLHADDRDVGVEQLGQGGHASGQAAAADGDQDHIHVGEVLKDLVCDGALAGGYPKIVEGVDIGQPLLLSQLGGLLGGLVEHLAVENDPCAVVLGVVDLHQGGGGGHHDGGGDPRRLGGIGQPLGVVAGGGGDEAPGFLLLAEGADLIVGPADLIGAGDLHIFRLEIDLISTRLGQGGGVDQAGGADHALQRCTGSFELFQGEHIGLLCSMAGLSGRSSGAGLSAKRRYVKSYRTGA